MGILVCLNVFLMKFLFYWILTGMGMRESCPIKCIGYYLVEDLFFGRKKCEVLPVVDVLFKRCNALLAA